MFVIPDISRSEISGTQGWRVLPWVPALGLPPSAGMTREPEEWFP